MEDRGWRNSSLACFLARVRKPALLSGRIQRSSDENIFGGKLELGERRHGQWDFAL
ncbi:MAG: hypothetical protein HW419_4362 [Deltaproteobacteria bacterium]|nr:hypothetical protein [Deltaproteobacteria bacterium]